MEPALSPHSSKGIHSVTEAADLSRLWVTITSNYPAIFPAEDATDTVHEQLLGSISSANVLKGVAERDDARRVVARVVQEAQGDVGGFYAHEAARLSDILQTMGLSNDRISKTGEADLGSLTSLAIALGLGDDVDVASYQTGLTSLVLEELALDHDLQQRRTTLEQLEKLNRRTEAAYSEAHTTVANIETNEELDRQRIREQKRNAHMLRQKGDEYLDRLQSYEHRIPANVDSYSYGALVDLKQEIADLAAETEKKETALDALKDLPPDITLARLKLGERKRDLRELIDRKQAILQGIAGSLA
ncbi:uncharacterized protein EV422DRAFT_566824 [Fimicolochytrium jonesii]|uniref:uncharacterized protein n=1 Tax=Fimicolochytrium jonesii TaxID=1396493 RepID=UPI0022FE7FA8|nr:uncharacterized protein EV422DRAFT_566824 [Fimicolochytrium jonesii]KAI8821748.1 hypothetical protein EV422DRAFT_566824 [Fimicolochytrium jonesii]